LIPPVGHSKAGSLIVRPKKQVLTSSEELTEVPRSEDLQQSKSEVFSRVTTPFAKNESMNEYEQKTRGVDTNEKKTQQQRQASMNPLPLRQFRISKDCRPRMSLPQSKQPEASAGSLLPPKSLILLEHRIGVPYLASILQGGSKSSTKKAQVQLERFMPQQGTNKGKLSKVGSALQV